MFLSYLPLIISIILKITYFIFLVISPALPWGVALLSFHCCSTAVMSAEKYATPLSNLIQKLVPASEHPCFTYTDARKSTSSSSNLA